MTILELTVVIVVLLSLVGILVLGARAWRIGSDRAVCIINIASVQKCVRSYANLYALTPGSTVNGLVSKVVGEGAFMEKPPVCPGSGAYSYGQMAGADTIPPVGVLYLECTLASSRKHVPTETSEW